jgi:hypothetical protein
MVVSVSPVKLGRLDGKREEHDLGQQGLGSRSAPQLSKLRRN